MSRLIVKNLPPYVTPARLRQHIEQKGAPGGTITDIKVSLKPDGTSRRFGFVGFKTDKEASAAKEWFDRTFIDSTRINVSIVEGSKDAPAPRPNKRRRVDSSKNDHSDTREPKPIKLKNGTSASNTAKDKSDANLDEFMKIMQPRTKKGPSWANETSEYNQVPPLSSVVVTPIPVEEDDQDGNQDRNDTGISDLDWMKRRMTQKMDEIHPQERVYQQSDDENEGDGNAETGIPEEEKDPAKETILQTSRLFLRNLAFSCTDSELMELFQPFGEISQVHIPLDPRTKQPKGLAYVTFGESSAALAAYEALDKKSFQGRLLHILPAVTRKGKIQDEEQEGKKKSLKGEKDAKRKANAGREFNWSMLYMNSDAVVSSVADRMNIAKADILNPESDNAAVKLALAETHIIQETKTYLESQGVVLSSFSSRARSDTTILVKNIPYGTTADQIREMFEQHGQLSRVLLPPAGTMAVVEFAHPDEAGKAFRAVAYRRLGNSVVYLEKGPLGMFQDTSDSNEPTGQPKISTSFKPVTISEQEADGPGGDGELSLSAGTTLFVKNISFNTSPDRFSQVFRNLPSFAFARIQTKPDPKRHSVPGVEAPRLSMGYGFVGFKTVDAAQKAMKSMQGFVLDGHALHVKFAGRGAEEDEGKDKGKSKNNTTKMIVKNVPFEATKKDIRELFGAHGHLKSVRLPKKFDSRSRGFAFLEFVTRHEAENAYAMLRHTHLLGRHLVLQWAEEGEQDLDVLRKKVGVGYGDGSELPGRKRKLVFDEDGDGDGEGGGGDD